MSEQLKPSRLSESVEAAFADLIAEITDRLQAGAGVDLEPYIARHPEWADRLRELLPALEMMAHMSASTGQVAVDGERPGGEALQGTLGDFRLLREVGRGGMGVVYEAEQISLGRRVALKVLPFAATMDTRQLQRFQNEARAAASLEHPHIVPVYGVGCERGVHYYAMKFIDGQSLAGLIAALRPGPPSGRRPLPDGSGDQETTARSPSAVTEQMAAAMTQALPRGAAQFRRIAEWGSQAAEALEHAHNLGIVHRDVKPANLIVDSQGKLWVADFGLARTATAAGLTMSGDLLGTLRYMSPEQALARHGLVDHRTDIYSLGATLYELLTGQPAVAGQDRQLLLKVIADEEPPPPRALDRSVPADLETIVLKALAKEPAERYATAKELADDLRRFLDDRPIQARRPSWFQRLRRWVRRHQAVVTTATMTLILALAASTALIWREHDRTLWALHDAKVQRARAEERELSARRQLYAAHIAAARRAWEVADLDVVRYLLQQHIPPPGEEDLRGFEWYYLWGLCQGRKDALLTLRGHTGEVNCVQFSPDGKLLATAGQDHTVRLWDSATGDARAVLRGHDRDVNWATFSPDGSALATAGDDGAVKLWELKTGREKKQILKVPRPVIGVAFSPDGKVLAAGLSDGTVRWWDFPSGQERASFRAHEKRIDFVTFSPDGQTLATCAENVKLWDAATGKLQLHLWNSWTKVNCVRFNHRGGVVATASNGRPVELWDSASGQQLLSLGGRDGQIESVAFSPDDRILATASENGTVRLWDARTGKLLDLLTGHTERAWCVAFSPDSRTLASASKDETVRLWDRDARQNRKLLLGSLDNCVLAFSPDGKRLVGGRVGKQPGLSIWEVPSRRLEVSRPSAMPVHCLALAPDGRTAATGHIDGGVIVWDLDRGKPRLSIQAGERTASNFNATVAAFTSDGKTLLTNDNRHVVRRWEVSTGNPLPDLTPANIPHRSLAYAARGNILATGTSQGIVLWNLASGSSQYLPWTGQGEISLLVPPQVLILG